MARRTVRRWRRILSATLRRAVAIRCRATATRLRVQATVALPAFVRDHSGVAQADAEVVLVDPSGRWVGTDTTGSDGRYSIGVAAGRYDVLVLTPGLTVSGTVRDEHGTPVPGVNVSLWERDDSASGVSRTGPDGSYRLSTAPGTYRVHAQFEPAPSTAATTIRTGP